MNDHPYTLDRWATPDDPEHGVVRFSDLRKMERACQGIWAISRIVGNGANDLETAGNQQLDPWVVSNLLGGIESLCDHITDLVESALDEFRFTDEAKPIPLRDLSDGVSIDMMLPAIAQPARQMQGGGPAYDPKLSLVRVPSRS